MAWDTLWKRICPVHCSCCPLLQRPFLPFICPSRLLYRCHQEKRQKALTQFSAKLGDRVQKCVRPAKSHGDPAKAAPSGSWSLLQMWSLLQVVQGLGQGGAGQQNPVPFTLVGEENGQALHRAPTEEHLGKNGGLSFVGSLGWEVTLLWPCRNLGKPQVQSNKEMEKSIY